MMIAFLESLTECFCNLWKCGNGMITRQIDDQRFVCWTCPTCQEGHGSSVKCGFTVPFTTEIECVQCQPGISFSDHYGESSCQYCGVCLPNEEILKNCTPISNIKCGKCEKSFYRAITGKTILSNDPICNYQRQNR